MSPIRILPTKLVNQIAAGEVVERPASVVKELLENAVDAQAGRISVEVEAGGKKLVRISDDGLGMSPEDVAVVFRSHATSKLADAEGLYRIRSLGFRGEAMASIGSVAHVLLVSRSQDADEAAQVEVRGGDIGTPKVAGAGAGTTVEVRNLFYNVPARRKFLKTDATEMGHIIEQFTRVALAYPTVGMSLKHNGRHVHELPPGTLLERVGAFFGGELASALHPIKVDEKEVNLWGFIAPPSLSRATTKMQYLFINGRYIRDRSLFHAIREGYRGLL
ncbi:MAG: DNA mismatch repair endonuclease MutL, partial [Planctomycetia bacterium]|nr:DNA mismatch repair endonuclease MutL [Planctomycetia bacterium]